MITEKFCLIDSFFIFGSAGTRGTARSNLISPILERKRRDAILFRVKQKISCYSPLKRVWWIEYSFCSETTLTGESQIHISTPLGIEPRSLMTGSKQVVHWTSETWYECSLSTGLPPSSRLCQLWTRKEDLQRAWNRDRRAVWDQVGLSHCRHDGIVMVRDEAHLRRGHNDQSRWGHQYSETTLTGESRFHMSTPLGIEPGSLMMGTGSPLDQWDMVWKQWDCRLSTLSFFLFNPPPLKGWRAPPPRCRCLLAPLKILIWRWYRGGGSL